MPMSPASLFLMEWTVLYAQRVIDAESSLAHCLALAAEHGHDRPALDAAAGGDLQHYMRNVIRMQPVTKRILEDLNAPRA
jgi:hypothetical protein